MLSRHINIPLALSLAILGASIFVSLTLIASAQSGKHADIDFPIAELGNCSSEADCQEYCNQPGNLESCIDFGLRNGLMTQEEADHVRELGELLIDGGPGGCVSDVECEAYCDDVVHIDECLDFAEEHDVLSPDELAEARQVADALRAGAQLPGGCTSRDICDAYCSEPANIEECVAFAEAAGFISPEEAEEAHRIAPLMASGQTPGGCTSEDECKSYCEDETHFDECINFAVKAGFMTADEAEMARKTGGKGPGGCTEREECDSFCENPANQRTCFEFAREHDLLSDEDLEHFENGVSRLREELDKAPPEVVDCLKGTVGSEVLDQIRRGEASPQRDLGEQMRACFEDFYGNDRREGEDIQFEGGCPLMPTVDSCPEGSERVEAYSSPECGTYYTCVPAGEQFDDDFIPGDDFRYTDDNPNPTDFYEEPPELHKEDFPDEYYQEFKNGNLEDENSGDFQTETIPTDEPTHANEPSSTDEPTPSTDPATTDNHEAATFGDRVLGLVANFLAPFLR